MKIHILFFSITFECKSKEISPHIFILACDRRTVFALLIQQKKIFLSMKSI